MLTKSMKPLRFYSPIERIDSAKREIEVYAFVNEVVEGEGGVRLLRSAMEAASPDYMQYANVREMHQPSAVGIVRSMTWDEKGCRQIIHVVDDDAWAKCEAGVYKGASVGVLPTLARGLDVTQCKWFETSLVDRPKDPDARFICLRADGTEDIDDDTVIEVTIVQETPSVQDFASAMMVEQLWDKGYEALDALWSVLYDIAYSAADNKAELISTSIDQFKEFILAEIAGGKLTAPKQRMMIALPADIKPEQIIELRRALAAPVETAAASVASIDTTQIEIPEEALTRIEGSLNNAIERSFAKIDALIPQIETIPGVIERLEQSSATVAEVQEGLKNTNVSLDAVIERVEKVENQPAELVVPVKYTESFRRFMTGTERQFGANGLTAEMPGEFKTRGEVMAEINRLQSPAHTKTLAGSTDQDKTIARVQELKRLADLLPD